VKKAHREVLEAIDVRIAVVREFLVLFKRAIEYDIVPIADVYGPTAWDPNIQVLIVSRETMSGANASEFSYFV
jgi:pantetheine-phosphate adenylyltransferase